MTNSAKAKGDRRELEVQELFRGFGFAKARRALGAGRKDDVGDIDGLRELCIQVTGTARGTTRIWEKLPDVERQRSNRRVRFGALFIKYDRKPWLVILTPAQFIRLYKYALIGLASTRAEQSTKMQSRGNGRRGSAGKR